MDDFLKNLKQLNPVIEELLPDWMRDYGSRVGIIIAALPDNVPDALTIISIAIDTYAHEHNVSSSLIWKTLTESSTSVHNELGDF